MIAGFNCQYVIADKGYDANDFRQTVAEQGATPVIPPRTTRTELVEYDTWLYRERHLVECFMNKFKHFRRLFSRFDKLDRRFLAFLSFVAALIWLR